jgi:aspartate aminotransferase
MGGRRLFSEEMSLLGKERSMVREIYEYGRARSQEIGEGNVFDFSTAIPGTVPSDYARQTILGMMRDTYSMDYKDFMLPGGSYKVREAIVGNINKKYDTSFSTENLYITSGALSALCICIKAVAQPEDEFITFVPYDPEYEVLVKNTGAKLVPMKTKPDTFQIDFPGLWEAVNSKTKGIIISNPGNPSGVVFPEEAMTALCRIVNAKAKEYNHPIYMISDDSYKTLMYDDISVPYIPKYYANTFVCYSYGVEMSMPGESVGYVLVSNKMEFSQEVYMAVCGAARSIGQVCVSALLQQVAARYNGSESDAFYYMRSRDMLCEGLTRLGFKYVKPNGGCFLLMKSPEPDAKAFCEKAKKHELLLVPGDIFGCPGYVRLAYSTDSLKIMDSLRAFSDLAKEYLLS